MRPWAKCLAIFALAAMTSFAADNNLSDAFYNAIRQNDVTRLAAMLHDGADVNQKDARGETPLMYASAVGSVEAMKLLIGAGADLNAQSESGANALIWSATDLAKVRLLIDHVANVNAATKDGRTALLVAAMSDHSAEIVRLLMAKGADMRAKDSSNMTALGAAAFGNDTEAIRMMIDAGVDVDVADQSGKTPLMIAAGYNGNLRAVKMLLAKGAKVNAVGVPAMEGRFIAGPVLIGSMTPLLLAAPFGPPELIQALLDAGAYVNVVDVRGMTPLMLAVATDRQDPAVIRMLLDHGAITTTRSKLWETALDWARKIGLPTGLQLLGAQNEPYSNRPAAVATKQPELRTAVEHSVALMEKASQGFFAGSGCISCHAQSMTDMAVAGARAKGFRVDEKAAEDRVKMAQFIYQPEPLYERQDPPGAPEQTCYSLLGLAALGYAPDRMTDAMVVNTAAQQMANGSWHSEEVRRPPAEEGDIFRTGLCVRALQAYGPPGRAGEMAARILKARQWLLDVKPYTAEDRNMQLLGLQSAGANAAVLKRLAKAILAKQRPDGGWQTREGLPTDAYATGESLYALAAAGSVDPTDASYQKGVKFLLTTQAADGSWHVISRAPKIQTHFESGFPYGGDQFISAWATGWATMALAQAQATQAPTSRAAQ